MRNAEREDLSRVGFVADGAGRSGSFVQRDGRPTGAASMQDGVDVMPVEEALERVPGVRGRYFGKAFERCGKDFERDTAGGYFVRVRAGVKTELPLQACLWMTTRGFRQRIHNIVVVEEGADALLINGCTSSRAARESHHLGVSEFFVHRNGRLNFTMIHSWGEDVDVEPRSAAVVEEGGVFLSNYVCLRPVRKIVMYPTCLCAGAGARARFSSIILGHPGSLQDIGGRVILDAPGSSAEIVSRTVSVGGTIVARGHLVGGAPGVKAHLECRGLMLSPEGRIHAIPELETRFQDVEMSHEAAIGRIRRDEIEYLASRGIPEEEAQSVIIRGFMDTRMLGLPPALEREVERLASKSLAEGL